MTKNKLSTTLIVGSMALVGLIAGIATMASAQSTTTTANTSTVVTQSSGTVPSVTAPVDKPESANDPADTDTGATVHKHAPLGGDGVVSSVTGTTIVMVEESDEGAASYTVDASKATITNNGAAANIADIKGGDKIFVQGPVRATTVVATSVSLGPGGGKEQGNDSDGSAASEASEGSSTSGATDQ